MTAVSLTNIDLALITRYSGMTISVAGTPTAVEVFIEEPSTENYSEKVYPSVSLKLIAMNFDPTRSHSSDDDEEQIAYNDTVDPPERTMRLNPQPYSLLYSLDTWHKVRAIEDRDLLATAIIEKTPPRGYISVNNVDGETEYCWVLWSGGVVTNDEEEEDYVVYHKTLTLNVFADLLIQSTTRDVKVVTDNIVRMYGTNWKITSDGKLIEIISGEDKLFGGFRMTETEITEE